MGLHCKNLSEESEVLYKGKDVRGLEKKELRERMMYLSNNPYIYRGSVDANLDPYKKFTEKQKKQVLSYLKLAEFFNTVKEDSKDRGMQGLDRARKTIIARIQNIRKSLREKKSKRKIN